MSEEIKTVKIGLFLVMLSLFFGIGSGMYFGVAEHSVKSYISEGIAANEDVHDSKSKSKIWRYVQRSHFHASGISAYSFGLIILVMFSSLKKKLKKVSSILIGLGGLYSMSWFSMFILAPSLGRGAAHEHFITKLFVLIGVGGLILGTGILCANLFLGMFKEASINS